MQPATYILAVFHSLKSPMRFADLTDEAIALVVIDGAVILSMME
jgi:hypothetical protein